MKVWRSWVNLASVAGLSQSEFVFCDTDLMLVQLSEPGSKYMKALEMFERRIIVGMSSHDTLVPAGTALICLDATEKPLPKTEEWKFD
jgi:hypothetical protein